MRCRALAALHFQERNFRYAASRYEREARRISRSEVVAGENRLHEFYSQSYSLLERVANLQI